MTAEQIVINILSIGVHGRWALETALSAHGYRNTATIIRSLVEQGTIRHLGGFEYSL